MSQESSPALQTMEISTFHPPDEVAFSKHVARPYSICKCLNMPDLILLSLHYPLPSSFLVHVNPH